MDKRTDVEMLPPPPSVIVIDVGQSSTEFMRAVRAALPPERRGEVLAIRFRKSRGWRRHVRRLKAARAS